VVLWSIRALSYFLFLARPERASRFEYRVRQVGNREEGALEGFGQCRGPHQRLVRSQLLPNRSKMIDFHLLQYLNTVSIRLRVYDLVVLGTQHDEVVMTVPPFIVQRRVSSRSLAALRNDVRNLRDYAAALRGCVGAYKRPIAVWKRTDTPRFEEEPFYV
jgi:hypothetical protein